MGSKGTHLGRFRQFNTPLQTETGADLSPRPGDLQSLRTWPSLGEIIQRQHIANSSYNALQVKAEKRLTGRVSLLASFVWSKSIDDADTVIPGFYDSIGAQDENNLRLERALSSFNVGRRISGGYVVSLPAVHAFGPVLRNWQLTGTVTLQDGMPANVFYYAFDPDNTGLPNRPNIVPGVSLTLPRSQRIHWGILQHRRIYRPGALHLRRCRTGYREWSWQQRLRHGAAIAGLPSRSTARWSFALKPSTSFNHPNWGIPGTYADFGPPLFGGILGTGDPRRLQFAVRYDF